MEKKFIVCEKMESIDDERSVVGWGSKPVPDRDGELIESSAWKLDDFRKNPILMLCHDYQMPPVGKILWIKSTEQGLRFKAKFANTERGREVYELYKDGIMSAFSVGFSPNLPGGVIKNPTDVKYKGLKKVYKDVNLLEISCVPIPSNSEALVEYVKAGKIQTKQLKDEMNVVIEIITKDVSADKKDDEVVVEKGTDTPAENQEDAKCPGGGIIGSDYGKFDECENCEFEKICNKDEEEEGKEEKEVAKAVDEGNKESVNSKCPVEGGVFGVEFGKYEDCKGCKSSAECKSEVEEGLNNKEKETEEVVTKVADTSGVPSIYDITNAVSMALSGYNSGSVPIEAPSLSNRSRYVVDLFPTNYPSGSVVYCESNGNIQEFFKVNYSYKDGEVSFTGNPTEVVQSWVFSKYGKQEIQTKEIEKEEVEVKAGRVLSEKNRSLLINCAVQMKEAITAIDDLIAMTELPVDTTAITTGKETEEVITKENEVADKKESLVVTEEEDDDFEISDKVVEEIEIVEKKVDHVIELEEDETKKQDDSMIEINELEIREILTKTFKEALSDSVKEGVGIAIRKAQGRVM